jgi:pimeloyl-ACP methyl ester carboxylesterase
MSTPVQFAQLAWRGAPLRLEYQWVGRPDAPGPTVVFLHEGLGSVSAWKDYPHAWCAAHGFRGLVYSRYGYGQSTPRPAHERWAADFMHVQAREVLPQLLDAVGVVRPWLFGHSDGASIALLHAATHRVAGLVVVAPHIMVEDVCIASIVQAREAYLGGGLRARLARHHADPDSAFWGWNDAWLAPAFRRWDITGELDAITCPVLAVQGEHDEYGTLEQVHGIARRLPKTRLLVIPNCAHSPHRERPQDLSVPAARFMHDH